MSLLVKICGLKTPETVAAALEAGADMVGFVFFPRSPRNVSLTEAALLAEPVRGRAGIVALTVDATDDDLAAIVDVLRPDLLQLHGAETPKRAAAVRARFGVPVMKAVRIAEAADLAPVAAFAPHVDRFLFDAKPPPALAGALPGGNGLAFDWRLVRDLDPGRPYMLSGGLDPANVARAIAVTRTPAVDVSSGVESAPGVKDPDRIRAFLREARAGAAGAAGEAAA
ncbi:phosphoribosylanthranilate isomerase [Prosthecomicrobium sp. N25]|uniref:phosphoribosylanthranilate isomerase n=1 Tax=Prosthecomicrobium sp. N25 TaxID=3129254 RepID=UPI0030789D22